MHEHGALRVATYNVRDLLDDVRAVTEVITALRADVVALQEVPRHLLGDLRVALLAARSGYRAPMTHALGGGTTLLWSPRVRVRGVRHVPLRVPVGQRRRGAAVLDAEVDGMAFRVVSVHLGLQPVQRVRHAAQLRGVVDETARVVVAGDMNEPSDGPAAARLGLEPLGEERATYPAEDPVVAIDAVLGRGWRGSREIDVEASVDASVLARASDHRPRLVVLDR